jgi:YggT family protein
MPESYASAFDVINKVLLGLAIVAGGICLVDWAIRTRQLNPFGPTARLFRRWIDPLLKPIENMIVRRGGMPQQAPFYAFMVVIVGGLGLIYLLRFLVALYLRAQVGVSSPGLFGLMLLGWAFDFLILALFVRVVSSFLPISPFSKWVRWSYVCTEWFMAPLRKLIPPFGQVDFTPLVAYFLLKIVGGILGV